MRRREIALAGPVHKLERHLRKHRVIARFEKDRLLIRTVLPAQEAILLEALSRA